MITSAINPLAKKYATAYLAIFYDKLSIDLINRLHNAAQFFSNQPITFFLKLPFIDDQTKKNSLLSWVNHYQLPDSLEKLIDLLLAHKRTFLLPEIIPLIIKYYYHQAGIMPVTIATSHSVDTQELEKIKLFLEKETHRSIIYNHRIDKKLIAGIRINNDHYIWEDSLAKKLHQLSVSLIR